MEIKEYSTPKLSDFEKKLIDPIYKFYKYPTAYNFFKIPKSLMTFELAKLGVTTDGACIRDIPREMINYELCKLALENIRKNPYEVLLRIPSEFIDDSYYLEAVKKSRYLRIEENRISNTNRQINLSYNFEKNSYSVKKFYYITDIHLEHQLSLDGKNFEELYGIIYKKIIDMLEPYELNNSFLLLGGDIADNLYISNIFYLALSDAIERYKNVKIISVLGNHELWNEVKIPNDATKDYSNFEVLESYRKFSTYFGEQGSENSLTILENDVWIWYKDREYVVIPEKEFIEATEKDLTNILDKSTVVILGGLGYSGLNRFMNANTGIYKDKLCEEEDIYRTRKFKKIYDKLKLCAKNKDVIILTHMPKDNWSEDPYNKGWIYINGHTHQNINYIQDDAKVLSDNQIGYIPKSKWNLKCTSFKKDYNPFESLGDGIYIVTDKDYNDFLYARRIIFKECNLKSNEKLYMLKNGETYMFVLETLCKNGKKSLCLLDGWKKRKLTESIEYYYKKIPIYVSVATTSSLTRYESVLREISDEVKKLGGFGRIHGFIVDIDSNNHIMFDPSDRSITIYYATAAYNNTNRTVYKNVNNWLRRGNFELSDNKKQLLSICNGLIKNNELPILSGNRYKINTRNRGFKTKYKNSNVMKKFEYLLKSGIIRIWKDEILPIETSGNEKENGLIEG